MVVPLQTARLINVVDRGWILGDDGMQHVVSTATGSTTEMLEIIYTCFLNRQRRNLAVLEPMLMQ